MLRLCPSFLSLRSHNHDDSKATHKLQLSGSFLNTVMFNACLYVQLSSEPYCFFQVSLGPLPITTTTASIPDSLLEVIGPKLSGTSSLANSVTAKADILASGLTLENVG